VFQDYTESNPEIWFSTKEETLMKNATRSAPPYKPPAALDFRRIHKMWKMTEDGKRQTRGSETQKLSLFLNTSTFNALLRLDSLKLTSQSASVRQKRQFESEKRKLRRDIKVCAEVGDYLVRQKLAADHR
jgi:hypothetical protein